MNGYLPDPDPSPTQQRFRHDCTTCTPLGVFGRYDLYRCGDRVIARYDSKATAYLSGEWYTSRNGTTMSPLRIASERFLDTLDGRRELLRRLLAEVVRDNKTDTGWEVFYALRRTSSKTVAELTEANTPLALLRPIQELTRLLKL